MAGNRRIAMAIEHPQHLALGIAATMRGLIVDQRQGAPRLPVAGRAFHRDDALPHRGQHFRQREFIGDAIAKPNAFQPGARHDQRIGRADFAAAGQALHLAVVELADAGVGGAAIVNHLNFRKQPPRIGGAPDSIGAEFKTLAARAPEIVERDARSQHQRVTRRIARQRRADHQARRIFIAGHVLQRMHRSVQLARQDGGADLRDESAALAAMHQQFAGLILIARGFELDDFDIDVGRHRGQLAPDFLGLRQRHRALARADPHRNCHHSRSIRESSERTITEAGSGRGTRTPDPRIMIPVL